MKQEFWMAGEIDARMEVERLLEEAARRGASDVHIEPGGELYEVKFRVDGLLETVERHAPAAGRSLVARLMVMAELLTYRLDIPQEGRLRLALSELGGMAEMRVAVMPTTHGMRAAVRLPADLFQPTNLDDLDLPPGVLAGLKRFAASDSGMLLLSGPAGAGKTTTIYALLGYIVETSPGMSVIALEDPVERDLAGVTQIEVSPFGELSYERSLRSILRQDPQVLMLGEIRDAATASLAVQAALSGHRLISTLHAARPWGALARLMEMGLEPYQISSAVFAVVSQRLLRRRDGDSAGYRGRVPVAEMAMMDEALRAAVLGRGDAAALQRAVSEQAGYVSMESAARELIGRGVTDEAEVRRVLGAAGGL